MKKPLSEEDSGFLNIRPAIPGNFDIVYMHK